MLGASEADELLLRTCGAEFKIYEPKGSAKKTNGNVFLLPISGLMIYYLGKNSRASEKFKYIEKLFMSVLERATSVIQQVVFKKVSDCSCCVVGNESSL